MNISTEMTMRRVSELRPHPLNEEYNSPLTEKERIALNQSIESRRLIRSHFVIFVSNCKKF
jgi:hypothetical protein